jgi:hypothetical protein
MHRLREPALLAAVVQGCELLSAGRKTVGLIELADLAFD